MITTDGKNACLDDELIVFCLHKTFTFEDWSEKENKPNANS